MWEAPDSTQGKPGILRYSAGKFRRVHMTAIHLQPSASHPRPASRQGAIDLLGEAARRIAHTLQIWRQRIRARDELARLDLRSLQDIGLTTADRDFLVNKPFWRE
jgi:uncharacterized protein YjiS (DUF1127 family)